MTQETRTAPVVQVGGTDIWSVEVMSDAINRILSIPNLSSKVRIEALKVLGKGTHTESVSLSNFNIQG